MNGSNFTPALPAFPLYPVRRFVSPVDMQVVVVAAAGGQNPPPGVPTGGQWIQDKYCGTTTWIIGLCLFWPIFFCPCDTRMVRGNQDVGGGGGVIRGVCVFRVYSVFNECWVLVKPEEMLVSGLRKHFIGPLFFKWYAKHGT